MPAVKPSTLAVGGIKAATSMPREDHIRSVGTYPCSLACAITKLISDHHPEIVTQLVLKGQDAVACRPCLEMSSHRFQSGLHQEHTRRAVMGVPKIRAMMPI